MNKIFFLLLTVTLIASACTSKCEDRVAQLEQQLHHEDSIAKVNLALTLQRETLIENIQMNHKLIIQRSDQLMAENEYLLSIIQRNRYK